MTTPRRDHLYLPLGDVIREVALGIADAQTGLDAASFRTAELMGGRLTLRDPDTGELVDENGDPTDTPVVTSTEVVFGTDIDQDGNRVPHEVSLMELGFVPTFYQFVDTTIEMRLSVRLTGEGSSSSRVRSSTSFWAPTGRTTVVHASTVDASFANSYGYDADLATKVSTKLVPIPPPAALADHLARLVQQEPPEAAPDAADADTPQT